MFTKVQWVKIQTWCTVILTWTYLQGKPRDVVWNQNFSCLGTGLPYAVGASIADCGGKRPVLFTTSDSAFHVPHRGTGSGASLQPRHIVTVVAVLVLMIYLALLPAPLRGCLSGDSCPH
ncbi:MAG: hypothetical protein IPG06_00290 [Haliea sp.]|nr:hypothetical protein [Haliea sp.]